MCHIKHSVTKGIFLFRLSTSLLVGDKQLGLFPDIINIGNKYGGNIKSEDFDSYLETIHTSLIEHLETQFGKLTKKDLKIGEIRFADFRGIFENTSGRIKIFQNIGAWVGKVGGQRIPEICQKQNTPLLKCRGG